MFRLVAFALFIFGFILELVGTSLGHFTALAAGLLGLAFLALAGVNFGILVRHR